MAVNHWSVKSNIWAERRILEKKETNLQLAFSMVLGLIHPSPWSYVPAYAPEFQTLAQRVKSDYRGVDFTSLSQSFWLSWEGLHTRSLQLAGLIAYILKKGGFEDVPRSDLLPLLRGPPQTSGIWTPPPPPLKLPLLEHFSDEGVRAQPTSWQDWYSSRIRDLVNTIEDEEWYGYYVYTIENTDNANPMGSSDPAMENIFFRLGDGEPSMSSSRSINSTISATITAARSARAFKLPLEARGGKDGIAGKFDFMGTVNPNTGIVSLRKQYSGAHWWDYDGVMTPLGIVGEWGREGTGYDGYFWLWKRSWMIGDAIQRTFGPYS